MESVAIRGVSNKIYTHLIYAWIDREDWIPYFGIGFNAEFGTFHNSNNGDEIVGASSNNNNCGTGDGITFALSKWAVFLKMVYRLIDIA